VNGRGVLMAACVSLLPFAARAGVHGWRDDGTNVNPTSPTVHSIAGGLAWSIRTKTWGNASPVPVGSDRLCFTVEPTTLQCVSVASGATLWQARNDVVDALTGDEATRVRALLDAASAGDARLATLRREVSTLQRDVRGSPDDAALSQRLADATSQLNQVRASLDEAEVYRTPANREIIGYASATPVTDDSRIFALFGNGVVSAYTTSGKKLWTRWLGAAAGKLRGYSVGTAASPLLVDGLLIVPWNTLSALDPATGRTVWQGPAYNDYGTPGAVTVGGVGFLAMPNGQLVRARDGAVVATGLGDLWYVGPVVSGTDVYYAGSTSDGHGARRSGGVVVTGTRLSPDGAGGVSVSRRFQVRLETDHTLYAQPVTDGGILYVATHKGELWAVSTGNGGVYYRVDLAPNLYGEVFASPVVSGKSLIVTGSTGVLQYAATGSTFTSLGANRVETTTRATPLLVGSTLYLRTFEGLDAFRVR
jgi:outer membrane protein assembly factor BamB